MDKAMRDVLTDFRLVVAGWGEHNFRPRWMGFDTAEAFFASIRYIERARDGYDAWDIVYQTPEGFWLLDTASIDVRGESEDTPFASLEEAIAAIPEPSPWTPARY